MKKNQYHIFSHELNKTMEYVVYGEKGIPCLFFPSDQGNVNELEKEGLLDLIAHYIDEGRMQLICCECNNYESWLKERGNDCERIEQQERFYHYIIEELVPQIQHSNKQAQLGMFVAGVSVGAMHAMNCFLRRPDIFNRIISLSGMYDATYYFNQYQDELVYKHSCLQYFADMDYDDPKMGLYRKSEIIICCGKGAWEQDYENSMTCLKQIFERNHIELWADYWGYDVSHDWYWWKKQFDYFLQFII